MFGSSSTPSNPIPSPRNNRGGLSLVGTIVLGLSCAIIGGCGVVAALVLTGVLSLNNPNVTTTTSTDNNLVTQSINVITSQEDTTVAEAVAAKALPSVVGVFVSYDSGGSASGSGVIYDANGNIITNYHVIEDAATITVTMNGNSYDAELVGQDISSDLAVIRADFGDDEIVPIEVGDSDELIVGDWVMAIGSPYGLDQSVSAGIVSAMYRSTMLTSFSGTTLYTNLIQTDAAVNPGNSGGALVNDQGKLVGICTLNATASESGASAGVAFAIPGNYATKIADTIISGNVVEHPYVGLSVASVTADNASRLGVEVSQGAYVGSVVSGGPADEAGIKSGDVVIAVGGEKISSADALILAIRSYDVGEEVTLTVVRGSEQIDIVVTLGSDVDSATVADSSSDAHE